MNSKIDDDFHDFLVDGAALVGDAGIPALMEYDHIIIPKDIIAHEYINRVNDFRQFVHFYEFDYKFSGVLTCLKREISKLQRFDGVITPDCSMLRGRSKCLLETNTYFSRAVGFFLQRCGMYVIANVRWSDKESYPFCFLGVQKKHIVSISTHGCIKSKDEQYVFKDGLYNMLMRLDPKHVLVHGSMPAKVFDEFSKYTVFHRYPSWIERVHMKEGER